MALRLASVGHAVAIGSRSALRSAELVDELLEDHRRHDLDLQGLSNAQTALADVVIRSPDSTTAPCWSALRVPSAEVTLAEP